MPWKLETKGPVKTIDRGRRAEVLAGRFLRRRLYRLVERNFACRGGEVDIVAARGDQLVFVEVRSRARSGPIAPAETVDRRKMERIIRAARCWLLVNGGLHRPVRFDVIGVRFAAGRRPRITHIRGAFTCDDLGAGRFP